MVVWLGLAVCQLNLNFWRLLSSMYVVWKVCRLEEPTYAQFTNLFMVSGQKNGRGWYGCGSWTSGPFRQFFCGNPTLQKSWYKRFVWAFGSWEVAEGGHDHANLR